MIHNKTLASGRHIRKDNECDFVLDESYLAYEGMIVMVYKQNYLLLNDIL